MICYGIAQLTEDSIRHYLLVKKYIDDSIGTSSDWMTANPPVKNWEGWAIKPIIDSINNKSADIQYSKEYSAKEILSVLFTSNQLHVDCLTYDKILKPAKFAAELLSDKELLFPRKSYSNEIFHIKNEHLPETVVLNNGISVDTRQSKMVAVSFDDIYPTLYSVEVSKDNENDFFIVDGESSKNNIQNEKTKELTQPSKSSSMKEKIYSALPEAIVYDNFGKINTKDKGAIIIQLSENVDRDSPTIKENILRILNECEPSGGWTPYKHAKGKYDNYNVFESKNFLIWISFGEIEKTMPAQQKLKYAVGYDKDGKEHYSSFMSANLNFPLLNLFDQYNVDKKLFLESDFSSSFSNSYIGNINKVFFENQLCEFKNSIDAEIQKGKITIELPIQPSGPTGNIEPQSEPQKEMETSNKRSEIKAAAMRSVAKKTIDLSAIAAERTASKLAKTKPMRDAIKKACQMPILKNAFGVGVGYALPVMPVIGTKPITKEIAEEIRIEGMSGIADATIGPLMGLFDSMLEKMPEDEVEEKNRIEKIESENNLDQDEEENDYKKRNRY
jgi:hypothetical protein